jgi:phosphoserine phosphatase RsbU/P
MTLRRETVVTVLATVEELPTQGPPLGIISDYQYEAPISLHLDPGDFLVLLTDGFTEWADPQAEQFGVDRAKIALQQHNSLPSVKIIDRLRADVLTFATGTSQKDDLTAVVIKSIKL